MTVRGKNDDTADGDIPYEVEVQAASSADPEYSGVDPDDVGLTNLDDDSAAFLVSSASPSILTEPVSAATFTVRLASAPAADVSIGLSSSDPSECLPSVATVWLTTANWSTGVTVTVDAVDDLAADGTQPCTIFTAAAESLDGDYDGVNPSDVALTVADNEAAGVTVTPTSPLETTESGGVASFTIVLTSQPSAAVVVSLASNDLTEGTLSTTAVAFTPGNWSVPRSVTVFGADDGALDGDVAFSVETVVLSSDPVFAAIDPADPALLNRDDEVDLSLVKDDGLTSISAGETVTYTIVATNLGPSMVTGVTVTDILPAILGNVSWSCTATPGSTCAGGRRWRPRRDDRPGGRRNGLVQRFGRSADRSAERPAVEHGGDRGSVRLERDRPRRQLRWRHDDHRRGPGAAGDRDRHGPRHRRWCARLRGGGDRGFAHSVLSDVQR